MDNKRSQTIDTKIKYEIALKAIERDEKGKLIYNKKEISEEYGIHRNTITNIIKQWKNQGSLSHNWNPNTKRITNKFQDELIVKISNENPFNSAKDIATTFSESTGIEISKHTVIRRLSEAGIYAYKPVEKPLLSDINKQKRLDWCLFYKDMPIESWRSIIWSDEAPFSLNTYSNQYVFRPKGEENNPKFIKPIINKFKALEIQVWGCIDYGGVGPLMRYEGRLNGDRYLEEILEGQLSLITYEGSIFQEDNAPCHIKGKHHEKFFKENKIERLDWPPVSPDLNPIENIWSYIGTNALKNRKDIKTKEDLFDKIEEEWNSIPISVIENTIDSVPKRIDSIIKASGGYISY